jgi:hypothetical protein
MPVSQSTRVTLDLFTPAFTDAAADEIARGVVPRAGI